MKRFCVILNLLLVSFTLCARLGAQDAEVGITVPVAITGGLLSSDRTKTDNPDAGSLSAGFRLLVTPQIKLGPSLYFYSAMKVFSTPFYYVERYSDDRSINSSILQMFLGYTHASEKSSVGLKVGKLTTAFGSFPLKYDDMKNPLLDLPLAYGYLKLRPDQLPCGVGDLKQITYLGVPTREPGPDVDFHCGGVEGESYGLGPATLYGLHGAEIDASWHRLDARLQLTNSSPANPRGALKSGQHAQWTTGAGYTIRQGFRVGMSAYRGPWLANAVIPYLPEGTSVRDFPASAVGLDVQWARGSWSAGGELHRFVFQYPLFVRAPASSFGYVEVKRIISPRWYSAVRANYQVNNRPEDLVRRSSEPYRPNVQAYEFAVGFRPNRFQLLKVGYEWTGIAQTASIPDSTRTHNYVVGIHIVTSMDALSKVLK